MKSMIYAGMAIRDVVAMADCRERPEVTITFGTVGDRARFERMLMDRTEAMHADVVMVGRNTGVYEFGGVRFKLAVRQVDAR